tara:strand:- start:3235 stop:6120 length:2886 start_codon:yes stop_codon:yes gene_type:complete
MDESYKKTIESLKKIISENIYTFIVSLIVFITIKSVVTSYIYLMTLSKSNINKSSCGSIGLTEAETFRSLLLGNNINDYNKYLYVIVISIITVIVGSKLYEIISESCMNDFEINKDTNIILFISIISIFYVLRLVVVSIKPETENIGFNIGKLFIILLCLGFFLVTFFKNDKTLDNIYNADNTNDWNYLTRIFAFLLLIDMIIEIVFFGLKISEPKKFREFTNYDIFHDEIKLDIAVSVISFLIILIFVLSIWKPTNSKYIFIGYLLLNLIIFLVFGSLEKDHVFIQGDTISQYNIPIVTFVMFLSINLLILGVNKNSTQVYSIYFIILFILFIWYIFGTNFNTKSFSHYSLAYFHILEDRAKMTKASNYFGDDDGDGTNDVNHVKGIRHNVGKFTTIFNFTSVFFFLLLFIYIIVHSSDNNKCNDIINKIITILIIYIIISYACGIFEIIFNDIFRLNDAAYKYKINLIKLNNEITNILNSPNESPIKIDKQKILPFKTFTSKSKYDTFISSFDLGVTNDIKNGIEDIRQEIRNVHNKTISDYQEILDNNSDQKAYENYLYNLIKYMNSNSNKVEFSTKIKELNKKFILENDIIELYKNMSQDKKDTFKYSHDVDGITNSIKHFCNIVYELYIIDPFHLKNIIKLIENRTTTADIPFKTKDGTLLTVTETTYETAIKKYLPIKNGQGVFSYAAGTDASSTIKITKFREFDPSRLIKIIKNITNIKQDYEYFSIFVLEVPITLSEIKSIYKQYGITLGESDTVITNLPSNLIKDINDNNIIIKKIEKNYGYLYDKNHELVETCIKNVQENKHQYLFYNKSDSISNTTCPTKLDLDILQSIDAKYFAASHLSYYADQNNAMSIKKFKKYYDYNDNDDENTKKISNAYNNISTEVDEILVHESFYLLLVVSIILFVIVLMILFNLAKIYSSNNIYTPQMYAVGFLGVFIVIFIFAEVIIARIK